jgi:glucokinase
VLGPGTGLGAAALLPFGDRVALQTSEAGHVDFGPADATEAALWAIIAREGRRVTAETLLSGPGLLRLYRACVERSGAPGPCSTPDEVRQAALAGTDDFAIEALRHFSRLLGRFAGDLALIFGADGGVFIGSGIAPTMADFLAASDFRRAFEDKAPYRALMAAIPTFVIMDPEPALTGLCGIAASPDRYIFDSQIWSVDKSEPASPPA